MATQFPEKKNVFVVDNNSDLNLFYLPKTIL